MSANEVAAFSDGLLLTSEVKDRREELEERAAAVEFKSAQKFLQRSQEHQKHSLKRVIHTPEADMFKGKTVFIDPKSTFKDTAGLLKKVSASGAAGTTRNVEEADIFVVDSVANPGMKPSWCLFLSGGWAVTPQYIMNGMISGLALPFKRPLNSVRRFCITESFVSENPSVTAIIAMKAVQKPSKSIPLTEDVRE